MPSRNGFDDEDFTEEDADRESAEYDAEREKASGYVSDRGHESCEEQYDRTGMDEALDELLAHDDSERDWQDFVNADEVEEFRDFFEDYLGDVDASAAVDRDRGPVVARRMGNPLYASDFGEDEVF